MTLGRTFSSSTSSGSWPKTAAGTVAARLRSPVTASVTAARARPSAARKRAREELWLEPSPEPASSANGCIAIASS